MPDPTLYNVMIDCAGVYKVGDPMPDGYIQRQEWAAAHIKAGLRQSKCCSCCKWFFPHQLSPRLVKTSAVNVRTGDNVTITSRICKECDQ